MEGQLRLLNWTASQCRSEINIWSDRYRRFFRQIHKMIPFLQFPPIIVRYESLQANSTGVLESLVLHLAPTIVQSTHTTKASDEWSKRTPENLRIVLTNFDEIHTLLSDSSCQTLLQMLVDDSARIFNPADSLLHVKDSSPYSCEASSDISYIQTIFQQSIIL